MSGVRTRNDAEILRFAQRGAEAALPNAVPNLADGVPVRRTKQTPKPRHLFKGADAILQHLPLIAALFHRYARPPPATADLTKYNRIYTCEKDQ